MARKKASKKVSKKAAGAKKSGEMLVVGSKVKATVRGMGYMAAGDLLPALSQKLQDMLQAAAARCSANKRSTIRPHDI
ncbi:MAG: hypothetical protein AB1486_32560 [Planctomycetota bacterium]